MSIRFENVDKAFGSKEILKQVSFEVEKGEIWFILGKSGMGKSVTLKHIIGVLVPDSGKVFVDAMEVSALTGKHNRQELAYVRQRCGMVFQHPALLDSLNLFDNIAFGLRTPQYREKIGREITDEEVKKIVHEKLDLVHVDPEVLTRFPHETSYGIQKRVSIARTLAPEPDYLLFDEPTTGLDPISTQSINALIFELSRTLNVTSIIVSHDMACALSIADQIMFLDQGKILLKAKPEEVVKSEIPLVKDFFQETMELLPDDWGTS